MLDPCKVLEPCSSELELYKPDLNLCSSDLEAYRVCMGQLRYVGSKTNLVQQERSEGCIEECLGS